MRRKHGGGSESPPSVLSPPPRCPDGSARDASRGSPGTKGIPGSREVGYKGCNGSQVHAVTRMPFLSPRMTLILARSWSQTQQDMECPGPVYLGIFAAAQDTEGIVHPSSSAAPLGHHWDTTGTSQPSLSQQDVVRIQPAPGTLPGTGTPHIVRSFAQMELGTAQGAGLSKWPGTYKVSLVQWGSPVAPLDGAEPAHARRVG